MKKICLFLMLLLCLTLVPALAEENVFAADLRLEKAEGTVSLTNASGRALSLRAGMKLYSGYTVATGENSCAYIRLDAERVVKLDQSTTVTILKQDSLLELTLVTGGLFFDINQPLAAGEELNIRTSTMVTGIRGTSGMVFHFEEADIQELLDLWQLTGDARPLHIEELLTGEGEIFTFIGVMDGQVLTTTADGQTWPIGPGEAGAIVISGEGEAKRMLLFDLTNEDIPLFVAVEILPGTSLWDRINDALSQLDAAAIVCAAQGHDETDLPYQPPACRKPGWTRGTACLRCGKVLKAQVPITALGHEETATEAIAATCTQPGRTAGTSCARCGQVFAEAKDIPAQGHTEATAEAVAATCTTDGSTAGTVCSVCGEVLTAAETIPALGHTEEVTEAVAATCTTDGSTAGTACSVCGEVLTSAETIPALGHTEEAIEAVDATCTTDGNTAGAVCSVCGEVLTASETIPALGHTEEATEAIDPTCTADGNTAGAVCSVCGEVLTASETIPALDHDMTEWFQDEMTGAHYRDCLRDCGYAEEEACRDDVVDGYCDVCGGPWG